MREMSLPQEKQLNSMERRENLGVNGSEAGVALVLEFLFLFALLSLLDEESFEVFFADSVDSPKLNALELLLFDEFQNSEVVKP